MTKLEQLKSDLADLDLNIAQGEQFEADGYECGMMLELTRSIRSGVVREIEELEGEKC